MRVYFLSFSLFILTLPLNFANTQKNTSQLPEPKVEISDTAIANQYFDKAKKFDEDAQEDSCIFYFKKASVLYKQEASKYQDAKIWEKYIHSINGIGYKL